MLKKVVRTKEILEMCRKCYSFKYNNEWHFDKPEHFMEYDPNERISVQFSQCAACTEEALASHDMEYA